VVAWAIQVKGNQNQVHAGLVDFAAEVLDQLTNREEMLARPAKPHNIYLRADHAD
jgi:hypothetical protein